MNRLFKVLQFIMIPVLLASFLALFAFPLVPDSGASKIQPRLATLAAESPEQSVRVIVRKADQTEHAERYVEANGGAVLKKLDLIHSFAAQLPAKALPRLARLDAVSLISLDARILSTAQTIETVRDEFNSISPSGNDGSVNWSGDWQEINESDGLGAGDVRIVSDGRNNRLLIKDHDGGGEGIQRQVDLSGASNATLTFDYRRIGLDDWRDFVSIEISNDNGVNWTRLGRFAGPRNDRGFQSWIADISEYISPHTAIRFISSPNLGNGDRVYFDNVQIEFSSEIVEDVPQPVEETEPYDPVEMKIIADDFEGVPYTFGNNSGTQNWSGEWLEGGESDGPDAGWLKIITGMSENQSLLFAKNGLSITRAADLSGALSATLSFEVKRFGWGFYNYLAVEVSTDGGANWIKLNIVQDPTSYFQMNKPVSYSINDYISGNTLIRFTSVFAPNDPWTTLVLDNVQILFEKETSPLPKNYYLETLNVPAVWEMGFQGQGVTVAVVDSGITDDPDFGAHQTMIVDETSLSRSDAISVAGSGSNDSLDSGAQETLIVDDINISRLLVQEVFASDTKTREDNFGHGTHVAGIIAGDGYKSGGDFMGVAPMSNLISLKVSDDYGMAYESDTVAALEWIYNNKDLYNIRVVNLSIQSTVEGSYHESALDAAVEILWFNGVVVVAAAGNKTAETGYDPIMAAPANDPFVITVGASDEKGDPKRNNDIIAKFTSNIETVDAFIKPDVFAPGKDIISVLASSSWWQNEHPERFIEGGYFRISGTSMATPMIAGTVALLLQAEPDLTPDQVKYRLMTSSDKIGGKGNYLDAYATLTTPTFEAANQGVLPHKLLAQMALMAYWASQNGEEEIDWGAVNWNAVNWNAVNWNAVNWNAVNWNAVNWNAVNWNAVNWNAVNWNAVNWDD